MNLIVISSTSLLRNEFEVLDLLFKQGLSIFHLRKKNLNRIDIIKFIEKIDSNYYNRIVLHSHFDLIDIFGLRGGHGKYIPNLMDAKKNKLNIHKTISCSVHSFDECREYLDIFDYMFISPIFDSISKNGYKSNFSNKELQDAYKSGILNSKVYALGGVSRNNINILKEIGFKGCAILGALWSEFEIDANIDNLINRFIEMRSICLE